jgi:hypothetical protein
MTIRELKTLPSLTASTTIDVAPGNNFIYRIDCALDFTVSGSLSITANGAPIAGTRVELYADFTGVSKYNESSAFCSFFGTVIPYELAVGSRFKAVALYDGSWEVYFSADWKSDSTITTGHIADDAVTTVKILDLNVTTAKINDLAVSTAKIANDAVTTAKIANNNVTLGKMEQMAANGFIGNDNGSNQDPQHLDLTESRTLLAQSITLTGDVAASSTPETYSSGNTSVSTTLQDGVVEVKHLSTTGANNQEKSIRNKMLYGMVSFDGTNGYTFYIKVPWKCKLLDMTCYVITPVTAASGEMVVQDHSGSDLTVPFSVTTGNTRGYQVNVSSFNAGGTNEFTYAQSIRITTTSNAADTGLVFVQLAAQLLDL